MNSLAGAFNGISDYLLTGAIRNRKLKPIETIHPVTRHPKVHKILVHAEGWKMDVVGFTVGKDNEQFATAESMMYMQAFLSHEYHGIRVPMNALSLSFPTANFQCGKSAQDFIPIDHTMPDDSYFSYQMLSANSQATFYNEDGQAYLAGICYYFTPKAKKDYWLLAEINKMRDVLMMALPFPHQDRKKVKNYVDFKRYGRDCKTAGRRVLVEINEDGVAQHLISDYRHAEKIKESCKECEKEHKNYKFVPKKKAPGVVVKAKELKKKEPAPAPVRAAKKEVVAPKKKEKDEPVKVEAIVTKDREGLKDFDFCDEMDVLSLN